MGKRTRQIEDTILERLAEGESLNAICADLPISESAVRKWAIEDEGFGAKYARARDVGFDCRAERAVEDAKQASDPQKARLAFDAERWYLGKMKPKAYGDAMLHKHADADGNNRPIDDIERMTRLAAIFTEIAKNADERPDDAG